MPDVAWLGRPAYKFKMTSATKSPAGPSADGGPLKTGQVDYVFDLLRGIAAYVGSPVVTALARTVAAHPEARLDVAFNHKQVACKVWARDQLHWHLGNQFSSIWLLGGWYGVMAAMLFDDPRFTIGEIRSIDLDGQAAAVALTLNAAAVGQGRFSVQVADMYALDYFAERPQLVINTSCEHIADLPAWLTLLPQGTPVLLQSNNYSAEPTHVNIMRSAEQFAEAAALSHVAYCGALPLKNYTRFMLIGTR